MMLKHLLVVVIFQHVTISALEISITQAIHNKLHHLEAKFRNIPDTFPESFERHLEHSLRKLLKIEEISSGPFVKTACVMSLIRNEPNRNSINFLKNNSYLPFDPFFSRSENPIRLRRKRDADESEEEENDEERDSDEYDEERDAGEDDEDDSEEDYEDADDRTAEYEELGESSTKKNKRRNRWRDYNVQTKEYNRQGQVVIKKVNGKIVSIEKTVNKLSPAEKKALIAFKNRQAKELKNMQAMIKNYINTVVDGIGNVVHGNFRNRGTFPRAAPAEKSKRFLAKIKDKTKSIIKYIFDLIFNAIKNVMGYGDEATGEEKETKKRKKKGSKTKTKYKRAAIGKINIDGIKEKINDKIGSLDKDKIKQIIKDKWEEKVKKKKDDDDVDENDEDSEAPKEEE